MRRPLSGRGAERTAGGAGSSEIEVLRTAMDSFAGLAASAASGDLETRLLPLAGEDAYPQVRATRLAMNRQLDLVEAYMREAGASLTAAGEGRFYRRFLVRGMPGCFRAGADTINTASRAIQSAAESVGQARAQRIELAQELESVVLLMSEQVAAAATELSASAAGLASSARVAVGQAEQTSETVGTLALASSQISQVVSLIDSIAAQTRLLALNATIEAARAGDAGRGFAVVAHEVKQLAEQTAKATRDIGAQVERLSTSTQGVSEAIAVVTESVREMDGLVDGVAVAANGNPAASSPGGSSMASDGLSQMAETLRTEVTRFLVTLRDA